MAQTFEGSNDLCIKAHDMELHLNKMKKPSKQSAKVENNMAAMMHPKILPYPQTGSSRRSGSRTKAAIIHPKKLHDHRFKLIAPCAINIKSIKLMKLDASEP